MIIGVTGHRAFKMPKKEKKELFRRLDEFLPLLQTKFEFAHGCAAGVDIWFGEYARVNNIKIHLYPPFPIDIQIGKWSGDKDDVEELHAQLKVAKSVHIANKTFSFHGYGIRNRLLVDGTDVMLGYYTRQRSGSGHAMEYCNEIGKPFANMKKREHYRTGNMEFVNQVRKLRTNLFDEGEG